MPFLLTVLPARGQDKSPILERRISISIRAERLDVALKRIAEQGKFSFSYSPSVVEIGKIVTYDFVNKSIREILDGLFNGAVTYKVRNRHVILTKAEPQAKSGEEKTISGYVVDENTGARLKDVSIYEPHTLTSAVTDSYGYFEIKVTRPAASEIRLAVKKQNYADTIISVPVNNRRLLSIPIKFDKKKIVTVADSVSQKVIRFWKTKILHPPRPNIVNIEDTLYRKFQFSVVPFIGTNHQLSPHVINDFSLNLLGGYARGVRRLEVGGLFNIDRGPVKYGQVAGVFNMAGGEFTGGQVAGALNANYGPARGVQIAGLSNLNWNSVTAVAVAGAVNVSRVSSMGFFLAGAGNITLGSQTGTYVGGAFNFSTKDAGPFQFSSALNFCAGSFEGMQLAGALNFTARSFKGSQLAGVMNFTGGTLTGSQLAGVLNYATTVRGNQTALVNFCDSISGVPVGLFSFVMKGYHKLEFSADEIFYTNVAFRTGVRKFHNILLAGAKPHTFGNDSTFWTFGYGFGSARRLTRWLSVNFDVTSQQIMNRRELDRLRLLNKVYLGLDLHITKHVSFAFGVNLNGYLSAEELGSDLFNDYLPRVIYEDQLSYNRNLKMWVGGKAGLRFF
ncbi:MAG TPA: carboxypeptidase-like regulatory domain-containing protein [Chryseosolibacter sp.]|nr:carboxypeptidase-like regulatory domain-containing protein [Chryseosolibacter sp.]